jgi:hypothetical protein
LQIAAQNQAELEDVAITAGDGATPRAWNIRFSGAMAML